MYIYICIYHQIILLRRLYMTKEKNVLMIAAREWCDDGVYSDSDYVRKGENYTLYMYIYTSIHIQRMVGESVG